MMIDDPKSGKCQRKHKVIIGDDEDDPEGMLQSDCYLCLSMIILYKIIIVTGDDGNNWVKIGYTQLTKKHKDDLLGGEWFNDSHIPCGTAAYPA